METLISLFISSIILSAALSFYLAGKKHYLQIQRVMETQLDVRWVSDLLVDSIRRAGFTPCLGIEQLQTSDTRDVNNVLLGVKTGNFLQINRMSESFTPIIRVQNASQIVVPATWFVRSQRPVIIADCEHAEVHQVLSIQKLQDTRVITLTQPLQFTYSGETYLGEWLEEKWWIKNNYRGKPALYYQLHRAEELTPQVHSLQTAVKFLREKKLISVHFSYGDGLTQQLLAAVRGA